MLSDEIKCRSVPFGVRHLNRIAWIALGSNLGNPYRRCCRAVERLQHHPGLRLLAKSPFYKTEPVGPVRGQPWYINGVVAVETGLGPHALMRLLLRIESSLGRNRTHEVRWGARRMDLDLLFFGNRILKSPDLTLPHPQMHKRGFVLRPLADLSPTWVDPVCGKTVDTLLQEVDDTSLVTLWSDGR